MKRSWEISKYAVAMCIATLFWVGCKGRASETVGNTLAPIVAIERFDQALPAYAEMTDTAEMSLFREKYDPFFPIYCRYILGLDDAPSFQNGIKMFLSNEAISQLYADTEHAFSNDSAWTTDLQRAFTRYDELFPNQPLPHILTHISGLNQSIITIDSLISISLDCYLGKDYPLYEQRYYSYEQGLHERERIAPDVMEVWLRTLFPYQSERNALLDRMVYEGKILYGLTTIFPQSNEFELLGYSDVQSRWCRENESEAWKQLVSKKHLFNTETMLINKYIEPSPFVSALHREAPGRLGRWIGLQIVKAYLLQKKKSAAELFEATDNAGEILSESKYNG